MAKSDSISYQIDEILTTYADKVDKAMKLAFEEEAKATAQILKNTSPKKARGTKKGAYARSWKVTKRGTGFVVHNARHARLTHLLENGHQIVNGVGSYGRTRPIKHIKPAEEAAIMKTPLRIESRLKRL